MDIKTISVKGTKERVLFPHFHCESQEIKYYIILKYFTLGYLIQQTGEKQTMIK